jgi:hypothetical protein
MAFFKTLFIASVAAVAFAAPQSGASDGNKNVEVSSSESSQQCGNGSKIACCNSGEDLIGLNCLSVPIRKPSPLPSPPLSFFIANHLSSSRHPDPAGLRLQRRCLLPYWRRRGQRHQPRGQLHCHPRLSVSSINHSLRMTD